VHETYARLVGTIPHVRALPFKGLGSVDSHQLEEPSARRRIPPGTFATNCPDLLAESWWHKYELSPSPPLPPSSRDLSPSPLPPPFILAGRSWLSALKGKQHRDVSTVGARNRHPEGHQNIPYSALKLGSFGKHVAQGGAVASALVP
jgi:hypothetical protein